MVINNSRIRATCPVTMTTDPPLFHYDVYLMSEVPLVAHLPSCAIGDACNTHEWQHTLETLGSWRTVPIVFTGYNRSEVMDDWAQITKWGLQTIVPPRINLLRGLRPFLDPSSDPHDLIYTNSTFAVARGLAA
jgi:hypothetical protein